LAPAYSAVDEQVPLSCRAPVRFVLGVELSCIYKKYGRVRRIHHLVFMPSFEAAQRLNTALDRICNIKSDGRPILGLDSKTLFSMVLDASPDAYLIPAHAWTPHFGIFGSGSGFDSLEECFDDLAGEIFAIETGLSSDPAMNARVSGLDRLSLMSSSDAHSLEKLGREANIIESELSYAGLFDAFRKKGPAHVERTLEFFPEEGKYHLDGHRACRTQLLPQETRDKGGCCPLCGKPVTVGVLHRVEHLADRDAEAAKDYCAPFENLISLKGVLGEILDVGPASRRVDVVYQRLLSRFGPELVILRELPLSHLRDEGELPLAAALERVRQGDIHIEPGYDGEYGVISIRSGELVKGAS